MKQKLTAVLCLIMTILFSACNTNTTADKHVPTSTPQITASPTFTPEPIFSEREEMILTIGVLFDNDLAFDVGDYIPGDIPKGEYAFIGINNSKYYCEKDIAGSIIDNENFQSFGYVYVHGVGNVETDGVLVRVEALDILEVSGAKELYEILTEQSDYNQGGMYKIGIDIPAGLYTLESTGNAYMALLSGPVGNNKIINNDNFNGRKQISTQNGQYLDLYKAIISE